MVTTSLLAVSASIPPKLAQLPHIVQLVNDLLQPRTLDAAVYYDLHRVIRAHASSRCCSTRQVLDLAAAHGHLGVLQVSRPRCSSAALAGAAANGHLDVVKCLIKKLRGIKNRHLYLDEALKAAAMNGQVQVVHFLRKRCDRPAIAFAFKLAAGSNHLSVLKLLLPWMLAPHYSHYVHHKIPETKEAGWSSRTEWGTELPDYVPLREVSPLEAAYNAAAVNGHVETVEFLLKVENSYRYGVDVTSAVEDAASNGHLAVVQLLVQSGNPCSTTFALLRAASSGNVEAVKLLVSRCNRAAVVRAACLAMGKNHVEVVELLMQIGRLGPEMKKALRHADEQRKARRQGDVRAAAAW